MSENTIDDIVTNLYVGIASGLTYYQIANFFPDYRGQLCLAAVMSTAVLSTAINLTKYSIKTKKDYYFFSDTISPTALTLFTYATLWYSFS